MSNRSRTASSPLSQRRFWALGSLLLVGAAAVAISFNAMAGERHGHPGHAPCADESMHHGLRGHERGMPFGGHHVDRLLDEAKLTEAQRAQIRQINDKARTDLKVLHEQARALHQPGWGLLTQAKPDAAAAEKQRQQRLALHDQVSKRLLQAQVDVANVLTPEQRATLASQMKARHDKMASQREARRAERQAEPAASRPALRPSDAR